MGFFARGGGAEDGERSEELARIEGGGIPSRAVERLKKLGTPGRDGSLFTSGLSVNEFALLRRMGPQPLAQVMGASVVRTGWQYLPALDPTQTIITSAVTRGYTSGLTGSALSNRYGAPSMAQVRNYKWHWSVVCELHTLSDAWNLARRRALDRLAEEALQVGADAVVGVHLHRSDHDLGSGTIEYVVTGTAIRVPGSDGTSWPVLTDVSVQDYWRLHTVGYEPAGFLATTSVWVRRAVARDADAAPATVHPEPGARGAEPCLPRRPRHGPGEAARAGGRRPGHGRGRGRVPARRPQGQARGGVRLHRDASRLARRAAWSPSPGERSQRHRAPGMGDHDARGGHGDPRRRGVAIGAAGGQDLDEDEEFKRMTDYDPKSVEGIPESGVERLEQNREGLYTSDLTVNEFMLVTEAGFDPVGLVVGSSIFHIGLQIAGPPRAASSTRSRKPCTARATSR
jgi:uncharacterized protein YbjQ (UPF0145 family)